jgi:hypothetical protein
MVEKSSSEKTKESIIGLFVLVILIVGGYYYFFSKSDTASITEAVAVAVPAVVEAVPVRPMQVPTEVPTPVPSPEEIAPKAPDALEEEVAAREEERLHDLKYGFHCLRSWDGSMPDFDKLVLEQIADRDSYELDKTSTYPVDVNGRNQIMTTFRARNALGGMVFGKAVGSFDNKTCKGIKLDFVE